RHYPDLPAQARPIARPAAREALLRHYFAALGAATAADVRKLFQWKPRDVQSTLARLVASGYLVVVDPQAKQPRYALAALF
ncbi:MAG: winged helix DNA-binding domain-containing protein, partial [Anaerolineales bacterium]|nr:winged helix DNA-binding domain-containing protein [Anaerolineales bacterium]